MLRRFLKERRRSNAVQKLGVLDIRGDAVFDGLVTHAAAVFNAPIAALSLIHRDNQWFKAAHGLELSCIPRTDGICRFALDRRDVLEVCDPQDDPRFAHLPGVVGPPHARYYIGTALRLMSGVDIGALCVVDNVVRKPASADQRAYLLALARRASIALETRSDILRRGSAA